MAPTSNRLIHEKSPYLLQHARNPVDWHPWGEEAFEKAKRDDKPIFLSIGYSTCHWCHVMERESFEDPATAAVLNGLFVSVKVDREERPDVDALYMNALVALTGQGGWPCNLFLTPDLQPFGGGTYFPPQPSWGRPAFKDLLRLVAQSWKERRGEAERAAKGLTDLLSSHRPVSVSEGQPTDREECLRAEEAFAEAFDPVHGGFGGAPKFPRPMALGFLLRQHEKSRHPKTLAQVTLTLEKMAQGGMYDQVGGGFARYSTDGEWLVPHFEKMLYDNALLAGAYLEGFQVTGSPEFARTARETFEYLFRDLSGPGGTFVSSEDADSEGVEGKFYVWTPAELKAALGRDAEAFMNLYGVTEEGNFEGRNILHLRGALGEGLAALGKDEKWREDVRRRALEKRSLRARPHRDGKVLVSWNALAISALCLGHAALGEKAYLDRAGEAYAFLKENLWKDGRLHTLWCEGRSEVQGFLDDHAFLLSACLDLFEASFDPHYLEDAETLRLSLERWFAEGKTGAFYFTGSDQRDARRLFMRPREGYDHAVPSGNSEAALALERMFHLTGRMECRERSNAILENFRTARVRNPEAFPRMLQALQFRSAPPAELFVSGEGAETDAFLRTVRRAFRPHKVLAHASGDHLEALVRQVPWAKDRPPQEGKPTAYLCRDFACNAPTTDLERVLMALVPPPSSR